MIVKLTECTENDADYICDKLVEYNLEQVSLRQLIAFFNMLTVIIKP